MRSTTRRALVAACLACTILVAACSGDTLEADAGADFSVALGEAPVFDGCDSKGDPELYTWTIVDAPDDMADDVGKVLRQGITDCRFTLESDMEVADAGAWVIELQVSADNMVSRDRVTVTVG